jgi:hypothetical protein
MWESRRDFQRVWEDSLLPVKHLRRAGLGFSRHEGSIPPMSLWPGGDFSARLWFIVRMSPPSYPSARLLPSRARFRFTW